jgi:hypothetical protein
VAKALPALSPTQSPRHKLVLQELLASPAGAGVRLAVAATLRLEPTVLLEKVRALPRLDFYVPSRQDRLTWIGTANVVVGSLWIPNSVDAVYTTEGHEVSAEKRPLQGRVLFVLRSEEAKNKRIDPQPLTSGLVIQDANDGELGGSFESVDGSGHRTVTELADLLPSKRGANSGSPDFLIVCPPDYPNCNPCPTCPPIPPPPPPPVDTTFISTLTLRDVCDNWFFATCLDNDNEVRWTSDYYKQGVGRVATKTRPITSSQRWLNPIY